MIKLTLLCLALPLFAYAAKKNLDLTPESNKEVSTPNQDLGSATPMVTQGSTKVLMPKKPKPHVSLRGFCTDAHGISYQPGDEGYESCIGNGGDKTRPASDASRSKPGIGITITK